MGLVFAYSLYSSILLTGMYLCYKWILSGENQHCFNRMVLWMIYIMSFCAWPVVSFAGQVCSKDMQGVSGFFRWAGGWCQEYSVIFAQ